MRTPISRTLRWVRRADDTRRMPGWPQASSTSMTVLGPSGVSDSEIDLSATDLLEMFDHPGRLETFSVETLGPVDLIPRPGRAATALADDG